MLCNNLFHSLGWLTLYLTIAIPTITATPASYVYQPRNEKCLTESDVKSILQKWERLWIGDVAGISDIVSGHFKAYNEDLTAGKNVPYVEGVNAFKTFLEQSNDPSLSDIVGISERTESEFYNCDRIALYWVFKAKTTGLHIGTTGIGPGKVIKFKGIDLLKVDTRTKKVYEVTTSEDNINYYTQIGYTEAPTKSYGNTTAPYGCPGVAKRDGYFA